MLSCPRRSPSLSLSRSPPIRRDGGGLDVALEPTPKKALITLQQTLRFSYKRAAGSRLENGVNKRNVHESLSVRDGVSE